MDLLLFRLRRPATDSQITQILKISVAQNLSVDFLTQLYPICFFNLRNLRICGKRAEGPG